MTRRREVRERVFCNRARRTQRLLGLRADPWRGYRGWRKRHGRQR
jgi:hypothetical protein